MQMRKSQGRKQKSAERTAGDVLKTRSSGSDPKPVARTEGNAHLSAMISCQVEDGGVACSP